jgi:hypothetical protein
MTSDKGDSMSEQQARPEGFYLGQHRGQDVIAAMVSGEPTIWVKYPSAWIDFAYPLDLNGTFKRWVDRRVLVGGPDFATVN